VKIFEILKESDVLDDALPVKLTAIVSQIHSSSNDQGFKKPFSLKAMLNKLRDNDISLSAQQFREMIEEAPLKNLIANVKGDDIIFKGDKDTSDDELETPDSSTDTLDKMAKRASSKLD